MGKFIVAGAIQFEMDKGSIAQRLQELVTALQNLENQPANLLWQQTVTAKRSELRA
jgi:hypothetical protein